MVPKPMAIITGILQTLLAQKLCWELHTRRSQGDRFCCCHLPLRGGRGVPTLLGLRALFQYVDCGVQVPVHFQAAGWAMEYPVFCRLFLVNCLTLGAGPGCIAGVDGCQLDTGLFCLVPQLRCDQPEGLFQEGPVWAGFLLHVGAWAFCGALCGSGHVTEIQVLDGDEGIVPGQVAGSAVALVAVSTVTAAV